jgi:hypothetical protein
MAIKKKDTRATIEDLLTKEWMLRGNNLFRCNLSSRALLSLRLGDLQQLIMRFDQTVFWIFTRCVATGLNKRIEVTPVSDMLVMFEQSTSMVHIPSVACLLCGEIFFVLFVQ